MREAVVARTVARTDCRIKGKRGCGGQLLLGLNQLHHQGKDVKNTEWGTFCFEKLVKKNCSGPMSASHVHLQPAAEPLLNCAVCQADGFTLLFLHCHLHFYSVTCSVTLSVQFHTVICSLVLSLAVSQCKCSFTQSFAVLYCHLQFCTVTCSATLSVQFYSVICSFALSQCVNCFVCVTH